MRFAEWSPAENEEIRVLRKLIGRLNMSSWTKRVKISVKPELRSVIFAREVPENLDHSDSEYHSTLLTGEVHECIYLR